MMTTKCNVCGKRFRVYPFLVKAGYGKHCSRKCYLNPSRRFWAKVNRKGHSQCWEWRGHINPNGYGSFRLADGKMGVAHRFSYTLHFGVIPDGMQVCHTCDNRVCVNPSHLFLGTALENARDCMNKGRQTKGTKNGRAKLTEKQVNEIRRTGESMYQKELGRLYGISQAQVGKILRRECWK